MCLFQGFFFFLNLICEQGEDDMRGSRGKNRTCRSRSLDLIPRVAPVKKKKKSLARLLMSYNPLRSIYLAFNLCQTSAWFTKED